MTIDFKGALFDDAGSPISGATVNLYDRDTTTPVRATTTTDANGEYSIAHATQGRFDIEVVNGSSKRRQKYDRGEQFETLEVANLRIRNPADTFEYDIVPAAIAATRTLNLPLITGTDTLVVLGLAQAWTADQTFNDNVKVTLGTGGDADIYYNGTNLILTPDVVGSGYVNLDGDTVVSDGHGLSVGHTAQVSLSMIDLAATPEVQILGTGVEDSAVFIGRYSADATGPVLGLVKGRGSIGASDIVQDNDVVGTIAFGAADGAGGPRQGASIHAEIDGTPADNDVPMALVFETVTSGVTPSERLRITAAGQIVVTGNIVPEADGTRNLGTQTTAQWANVWADLVNGADFAMANKWRMLESDLYKGYGPGWALGHDNRWQDGRSLWGHPGDIEADQQPVFAVTEDFIEYKGRRITPEMLDKMLELVV